MSDETNTQRHPLRILSSVFSFVRKHKILSGISVIVLLGVGAGIAWLAQPSVPEYIKAFSERGDIVQLSGKSFPRKICSSSSR
jgi:hypothetical protein